MSIVGYVCNSCGSVSDKSGVWDSKAKRRVFICPNCDLELEPLLEGMKCVSCNGSGRIKSFPGRFSMNGPSPTEMINCPMCGGKGYY